MFVARIGDGRHCAEVLTDELTEGTCACAVQDADASYADLYGIVDEQLHGVEGLVASHSAHVDILLEMEALLAHEVLCLAADEGGSRRLLLLLRRLCRHETIQADCRSHLSEHYHRMFAVDALYDTY